MKNGKNLDEETFKVNLNLLTKYNTFNLLVELLSDKNKVSLRVISYKGEDKKEIDEIMEFSNKSLLVSLGPVLYYFDVINRSKIAFEGPIRKEAPLINKRVLREAWINAVVHNDWSDYLPPIVHVFSNRIEIVSNGGLIEKMTKEEVFRGISKPRNFALMKVFLDNGLVEQTGY